MVTMPLYVSGILPCVPILTWIKDVGRNVCHGSDSVETAKKEIALWFKEGEVLKWQSAQHGWIYEKP